MISGTYANPSAWHLPRTGVELREHLWITCVLYRGRLREVRFPENKLPPLPACPNFFLAVNFLAIERNPEEAAFTLKHTEA